MYRYMYRYIDSVSIHHVSIHYRYRVSVSIHVSIHYRYRVSVSIHVSIQSQCEQSNKVTMAPRKAGWIDWRKSKARAIILRDLEPGRMPPLSPLQESSSACCCLMVCFHGGCFNDFRLIVVCFRTRAAATSKSSPASSHHRHSMKASLARRVHRRSSCSMCHGEATGMCFQIHRIKCNDTLILYRYMYRYTTDTQSVYRYMY